MKFLTFGLLSVLLLAYAYAEESKLVVLYVVKLNFQMKKSRQVTIYYKQKFNVF